MFEKYEPQGIKLLKNVQLKRKREFTPIGKNSNEAGT